MSKEPLKKDDPEHYVTTDVYPAISLEAGGSGEDPYNSTTPSLLDAIGKPKRRSLDDMRRLSETIKANRSQK
jgi:hypothetical protein